MNGKAVKAPICILEAGREGTRKEGREGGRERERGRKRKRKPHLQGPRCDPIDVLEEAVGL